MASAESLTDFLRRQQKAGEPTVDWAAVRQEWIEALDSLGARIRDWLQEAVGEGLIHLERRRVALDEESLGPYEAPAWELRAGSRVVSITPIARFVVGGIGRVDLRRGPKKVLLVRTRDGVWRIHQRDDLGARGEGAELSSQSFAEILKQLFA